MHSDPSSTCPGCGSPAAPGSRFCAGCGRALGAPGPTRSPDRLPWLVAGGALAGMLALLLFTLMRGADPPGGRPVATAATTPGAGAAPPDISQLSPRERFDRLYTRVMQAAQQGDDATVQRFTPMALGAYEMLDTVDADARYHAALLQVHTGDAGRARAQGDTILAQNPGHLLGYVILGTSARWRKDETALRRAYADFLAHYEAEMKANRPEYGEHRFSIDEFHRSARERVREGAGS